jgi:D-3-phosphoglycerate dehydrogenase
MRYRVLATPRSFGKGSKKPLELLSSHGIEVINSPSPRPVSPENLKREIIGMDAVIVGIDSMPEEVIRTADKLRVISKYGTGVDNIDLEAAKRRGIAVAIASGANERSVAELVLTLIFALSRRLLVLDRATKAGKWERPTGAEVLGKTLGVVGYGKIGKILAELASSLGMEVVICDPYATKPAGVKFVSMDELLKKADFVSLHVQLTDETYHLIGEERLSMMKDGAFLVNTSRADIVDEDALVKALRQGKPAGAAVDVYSTEPPVGSELLKLDNVVATPHMGSQTLEAIERMGIIAAENVIAVLCGVGEAKRIC